MIKFSVLYPRSATSRFDMTYYLQKHIPMVRKALGAACVDATVDEGVAGGEAGTPPTYVAMGHLYFRSMEAMQRVMGPHREAIKADVKNYTNVEPIIQISEVKLSAARV